KGVEIPLSIREYEGRLYMIGFDRVTNREKPTYRYYEQKGRNFQEIAPGAYPKAIATQNMWFSYRYFDSSKGDRVDRVQLAREIDPDNVYFHSTATAEIWCQLMTGKEYYEFAKKPIDRNVLMEFKAKYKPIKLTKIIRE
ncbi:MAG: hypothetical protein OEW04_06455, partial [Nitrospirota bacterium]|nr:hypothetical protein [Nitrospirota bacterium]